MLQRALLVVFGSLFLLACSADNSAYSNVSYQTPPCNDATEMLTDHQGTHELTYCNATIDNDTLLIAFPAELPAYWGYMEVKVINNRFYCQFGGVPFAPGEASFQTVKQELILEKENYTVNDTLRGYLSAVFIQHGEGYTEEFRAEGCFYKIIRNRDFEAMKNDNYLLFDLKTAISEFGKPIDNNEFNMLNGVVEFRVELLNILPQDDMRVKELTWEINTINIRETDRLTIWYIQKNGKWQPVDWREWNSQMQF